MEIQVVQKGDLVVLQPKGSLDMYSSLELKNRMDKIAVGKNTEVFIDFSNINFVDSSGIGTLIKIAHQIQEAGGKVSLAGLKPTIEKVFKISGLINVFPILTEVELRNRLQGDS
ncbi:MAG: STAS domain-containing protein [Leptospiraceae bacterium]|nr:STAS domain-containing protein [Leptospiraceae bacterium]MDW8306819.1 STAS domain-containing protein [Leptospiraceae bacterium]